MAIKKETKKNTLDYGKYIRWFWILFLTGVLAVTLIFLTASWGYLGEMPDHTQLENPRTNLASEIISSDGETLGKFYFNDNRTPVDYEDLPMHLVEALIAVEDARYEDHSGIDARGTLRAIFKAGRGGGGASTISQQLARQLFVGVASKNTFERITQKIKEWVIATRLERQYTKEEIIAQYFNIYDFGNNADGIRSAARIYFGKEPQKLNLNESAMLVGMFKNSSLYNPRRNAEGVTNRRNVVLAQMYKYEYISETMKDSLQKLDLNLNYTPESHRDGIATYFREYLRDFMKKWANEEANRKPDGSKYNINSDGLKIHVTLDSRMQKYAEDAVQQHMPRLQAEFFNQNTPRRNPKAPFRELTNGGIDTLMRVSMKRSERWRVMKKNGSSDKEIEDSFQKPVKMSIFTWDNAEKEIDTVMKPWDSMRYYKSFLQPGMMSMEPQTGHVKAWVGGMNYRHFQYDHVKQGKRQIGSTFKPFVYATAMDQLHMSPCDELPDRPFCIEAGKHGNTEEWCPENSNKNYGGMRTLKNALANSKNTITAQLIDMVGPQPVVDLAKRMGIEGDILPVPSIALGTPDLSVYEMVGAYSTFANKGVYTKPVMVTSIEDKNGTTLFQFVPQTKDVLSEEAAYVTVNLMEGVTQFGSGSRLRTVGREKYDPLFREIITGYPYNLQNPIAGKTGTTQNQSDGWFMGMVPNLVTGVWVGAEDRATHFAGIDYGQGASMALPIWGMYMKSCYEDEELNISKEEFEVPANLSYNLDCSKKPEEDSNKKKAGLDDELDF